MSRNYKREYELNIIKSNGETRIIKDLRINFEIKKSVISLPNSAKITIYNPNFDTVSVLQDKFTKIILNAGYQGNLKLLYSGEIRNAFQQRVSTDNMITIYAGDGQQAWKNSTFSKTYVDSVKINAVINDIAKSFKGVAVGLLEGLPDVADKLRGQSLSGAAKDLMDKFANEYGFNWSIQDGELVTVPITGVLTGSEVVLINSKTGMIGSPVLTEIGVEVTTLLNPLLAPNRPFKLESQGADFQLGNLNLQKRTRTLAEGLYKIQEVIFKGDNRDGAWLSTAKGISING